MLPSFLYSSCVSCVVTASLSLSLSFRSHLHFASFKQPIHVNQISSNLVLFSCSCFVGRREYMNARHDNRKKKWYDSSKERETASPFLLFFLHEILHLHFLLILPTPLPLPPRMTVRYSTRQNEEGRTKGFPGSRKSGND